MPMTMGISGSMFAWILGIVAATAAVGIAMQRWLTRMSGDRPQDVADPVTTARERYARGDISKAEFDQIAEGLVQTENPQL